MPITKQTLHSPASYFASVFLPGKAQAVRRHPQSSPSPGAASSTSVFKYFEFLHSAEAVLL